METAQQTQTNAARRQSQRRVHSLGQLTQTRSLLARAQYYCNDVTMSSSKMAVDKPEKLDVDRYLTTIVSTAPHDLHPYFEQFRNLHQRKSVSPSKAFRFKPLLDYCRV